MKLTYYGHSCFGVRIAGHDLLFDPYITENELAKGIDVKTIPAGYILLSHGHDDHTGDAVEIAKRTNATVIAPYELALWCNKKGVKKIHPMNPGGWFKFDFGRVKLVHAIHSSSASDGTYTGSPTGIIVESSEGNFYYSGDTALTMDMKLIGESVKLKFAVLCIGDNFTMGAEDAVKAAEFIRCNEILGVHYDTFPPIKIDHAKAVQTFKAAGKNLYLLKPGGVRDF